MRVNTDTAIVACVRNGQESKYTDVIKSFSDWNHKNSLILNTSKTKEMVVDLRRSHSQGKSTHLFVHWSESIGVMKEFHGR